MQPITPRISGSKIRLFREDKGLTQRELAGLCHSAGGRISPGQISNIERGLFQPRTKAAYAIAVSLGVTVADLRETSAA